MNAYENVAYNELRRSERVDVNVRTKMISAEGKSFGVHLVNISAHGFLIRSDTAFDDGERVRIRLAWAGDIPAKLVWSLGGRCGGEFERPFTYAEFNRLLAAIRP